MPLKVGDRIDLKKTKQINVDDKYERPVTVSEKQCKEAVITAADGSDAKPSNYKLSFKEDETSEVKCEIPKDSYIISDTTPPNKYIYESSDKSIIVIFKFKESYINKLEKGTHHIFKLFINAEYNRGGKETLSKITYGTEIKFKI
jgi:hypothetical protein